MKYIIAKGSAKLPLFWSRDGWASITHWASRYETKEAAEKAIKILGLEKEQEIRVEVRES
jgi:hypothetical protein